MREGKRGKRKERGEPDGETHGYLPKLMTENPIAFGNLTSQRIALSNAPQSGKNILRASTQMGR